MVKSKDETLKTKVYTAVLDGIIKGEYPAEYIINEKELIEKHQVSKSPVRDALIMLCNENILKSIPRYGYQIVKISAKEIDDILDFRNMIESQSIKRIIETATPEDIKEFQILLEKCRLETRQAPILEHWQNNTKFHLELNKLAKNDYIYQQLKKSISILKRAYAQFHWNKWHKTDFITDNTLHITIMERIISGDYKGARIALLEDCDYFKNQVKDSF